MLVITHTFVYLTSRDDVLGRNNFGGGTSIRHGRPTYLWFYGSYKDVTRRSGLLGSCPYHEARFEVTALIPRAKKSSGLGELAAVMAVYYRRLSRVAWTTYS